MPGRGLILVSLGLEIGLGRDLLQPLRGILGLAIELLIELLLLELGPHKRLVVEVAVAV
jgi:hypothetical protein